MKSRFFKIIASLAIILFVVLIAYSVLTYLYPKKYSEYVERYALEYGLDINLAYSIIKCESNFNESSVSHANAIGLMQITADTLEWAALKANDKEVSANSLLSPEINIKYGCYIYSLFYSEFEDTTVALACYNAGRGNVLSWLGDKRYSDDSKTLKNMPFSETRNYIKKIENTRMIYELLY